MAELLTVAAELDIAPGLAVPADLCAHTTFIVGIRGAGKTVAATVIAEEFCERNIPWVAFDPVGVWPGLRMKPDGTPGYPVLVVGGKYGDLPLDRDAGERLAEAWASENFACVVDLKRENKTTWRHFVAKFCDRLMMLEPESPRCVFLEEGPEFVPQRPMGEQKVSRAAVDRLIRLGRNNGYGAVLISQRFATVDKDVATQCETILAMRQIGKPDRTAVKDWVAEVAIPEPDAPQIEGFLSSLPKLEDREGWWYSPQWTGQFQRIRVRERRTVHLGHTRSLGQVSAAAALTPLADVAKLAARLKRVLVAVEGPVTVDKDGTIRATKLTPRQQKRTEIRDPEGEYERPARNELESTKREHMNAERAYIGAVAELDQRHARIVELEGQVQTLRGQVASLTALVSGSRDGLRSLFQVLQPLFATDTGVLGASYVDPASAPGGLAYARGPYERWYPKLEAGARRILEALLDHGGELSIRQAAVLAGLTKGSGRWRKCIGQLRSLGLVEKGDPIRLHPV